MSQAFNVDCGLWRTPRVTSRAQCACARDVARCASLRSFRFVLYLLSRTVLSRRDWLWTRSSERPPRSSLLLRFSRLVPSRPVSTRHSVRSRVHELPSTSPRFLFSSAGPIFLLSSSLPLSLSLSLSPPPIFLHPFFTFPFLFPMAFRPSFFPFSFAPPDLSSIASFFLSFLHFFRHSSRSNTPCPITVPRDGKSFPTFDSLDAIRDWFSYGFSRSGNYPDSNMSNLLLACCLQISMCCYQNCNNWVCIYWQIYTFMIWYNFR